MLDAPIQYLKGIGPKRAKLFHQLGINTVEDLLYYFPRRYEDRTNFISISKLEEGKTETLEEHMNKEVPVSVGGGNKAEKKSMADFGMMPGCPECGNLLEMGEGCMSCNACAFSRCV